VAGGIAYCFLSCSFLSNVHKRFLHVFLRFLTFVFYFYLNVYYIYGLSMCACVCVCDHIFVQNVSKSYERILMKFFGGVRRGLRTSQLRFGTNPDDHPDPRFLNADQGPDPDVFYCALQLISFSVEGISSSHSIHSGSSCN